MTASIQGCSQEAHLRVARCEQGFDVAVRHDVRQAVRREKEHIINEHPPSG